VDLEACEQLFVGFSDVLAEEADELRCRLASIEIEELAVLEQLAYRFTHGVCRVPSANDFSLEDPFAIVCWDDEVDGVACRRRRMALSPYSPISDS
jgi:hypothetical protein